MFRYPRTTQERRESQPAGGLESVYTTHFMLHEPLLGDRGEMEVRVRSARTAGVLPTAYDDMRVARRADRSWKARTKRRRQSR
jgi:hypothetical protein